MYLACFDDDRTKPQFKIRFHTKEVNIWFDAMVIPKSAQNIAGAHKFINFM